MDYTEETGLMLAFWPNVSSINVSVNIIDDNVSEGDQFFFGNLNNSVGPVTLVPDMATVTIFDDVLDRKSLYIIYRVRFYPLLRGNIFKLHEHHIPT